MILNIKNIFLLFPSAWRLMTKAIAIRFKKSLGLPIKPIFVNFLVTYQCNSRCQMCHIWQKYKNEPKLIQKELNLREIEKFLKENIEFLNEVKHFGLTGGEPFLRQDLIGIIKLIRKYLPQATTGIQTNGLMPELIKRKIKEIQKFYPEINASISLDGLKKTHDKIRGINGAFEKVIETFNYLKKDLKISRLTSGMVLNDLNYKEVEPLKDLLSGLNIEFSCFLPDKADYFNNRDYLVGLSPKAKKQIVKVLKENFADNYYMDNLRLIMERKIERKLPCYSGYTSIVIDPYGNILPCILRSEAFGNIKEASLKDILWSQKAKELRNKLKSCRCWNQCEVTSSAMVDIFDVFRWFLTSREKRKFIEHLFIVKDDLNL
jgi:Fe-coproporphyrin III synthase